MLKAILDLIFPVYCQGCGAEGTYLCVPCQAHIQSPQLRCIVCGGQSLLGQTHPRCSSRQTALDGLLVASDYHEDSIQKLIWHFKYNSVRDMSEVLSLLLADFFIGQNLLDYFGAAAVIPVPLHKRRWRWRGFNQAELLAQKFAQKLHLEYLPILQRLKHTKTQVELEKQERTENVKDCFAAAPAPALGERTVLLVDDVATTGATLNECAKVLKKQQAKQVWGLVVARN